MKAPLVIILAGGEGQRIGGSKPLRKLGGERLVDRACRMASRWSDEVRIALRDPSQVPGPGVPLLRDDPGLEGPLAGLASALAAAREAKRERVLTLPCDVPFVPDDLAQRLGEAIGEKMAALAESRGRLHPACALWRVEAIEHLPAYIGTGRRSLIGFAEAIGFVTVAWPAPPFFNVNKAEDLAEAERRLASEIEDLDD